MSKLFDGMTKNRLPLRSPLLRQSLLLSVPPPTDMLELGRSLCKSSGYKPPTKKTSHIVFFLSSVIDKKQVDDRIVTISNVSFLLFIIFP